MSGTGSAILFNLSSKPDSLRDSKTSAICPVFPKYFFEALFNSSKFFASLMASISAFSSVLLSIIIRVQLYEGASPCYAVSIEQRNGNSFFEEALHFEYDEVDVDWEVEVETEVEELVDDVLVDIDVDVD